MSFEDWLLVIISLGVWAIVLVLVYGLFVVGGEDEDHG